jgi:Serine incorporator (Serinc)
MNLHTLAFLRSSMVHQRRYFCRVEKSNTAEAQEAGSGKKWLYAILASCALSFAGALAVLIYLFMEFSGCPTNNAVIALTLIFCILITAAQLTGDEGSLLSSSVVCAWAVFLCKNALTFFTCCASANHQCLTRVGLVRHVRLQRRIQESQCDMQSAPR